MYEIKLKNISIIAHYMISRYLMAFWKMNHWTICLVQRVVEKHLTPFKLCENKLCMR